ncbi:MAG: PD40 domain-containing protein [Armatimonadetes bacterium]|nr:PD40 domain-containing protein [Armatimonadota bacterium]
MKRHALATLLLLVPLADSAHGQGLFNYTYEIKTIEGINSPNDDYAPALSKDRATLLLTSTRPAGSLGEADIFSANRTQGGYGTPVNPGSPLNTSGNDGAVAIAADGKTVVFSADDQADGKGSTDLYIAEIADGRITNIRNLGGTVNTSAWESQPAISGDGKTIWFASNRKGGYGKTDIWYTTLNGGNWSPPVNAGPMINTKKDERSPNITPDGGTLYFSSNGLSGFGGYDVFMAVREGAEWGQASNLGSLINSTKDELFFFAPSKHERFYFASGRDGGQGGLDIYYGTPNVFGDGMTRILVSVIDSTSGNPLPSVVNVIDEATGQTVATFTTNPQVKEYEQFLPAERKYRFQATIRDLPPRTASITTPFANEQGTATVKFGPISLAEFDLGRYNVPFFVTGYYRPNTRENLDGLYPLLEGPLSEAAYIERFRKGSKRYKDYIGYSQTIEGLFDGVKNSTLNEILPRFKTSMLPGEVLEIRVTGYADPKQFVGQYLEGEVVTFEDMAKAQHEVSQGDQIGNLELSGLRAWYSGHYLDQMLTASGNEDYRQLRSDGRVQFRYIGGGESRDGADRAAQRRIHIEIVRTGGASGGQEFDMK